MNEMNVSTGELVLGHEYQAGGAYWARFLAEIVACGLPHERFVHWATTAANLDDLLEYATHSTKQSWG